MQTPTSTTASLEILLGEIARCVQRVSEATAALEAADREHVSACDAEIEARRNLRRWVEEEVEARKA